MNVPTSHVKLAPFCKIYESHVTAMQETIRMGRLRRLSALVGPWGSGKTSFLREVQSAFHDPAGVNPGSAESGKHSVVMQFVDLWDIRRDVNVVLYALSHLVRPDRFTLDKDGPWYLPVIEDVLAEIKQSTEPKEKKWLRLSNVMMGLRAFGVDRVGRVVDSLIKTGSFGVLESGVGNLAEELSDFITEWKRREEVENAHAVQVSTPNWMGPLQRMAATVDEARWEGIATKELLERIRKIAFKQFGQRKSEGRIVLVIDNLDRCPPETMLHFIEGLRLSDREFLNPIDDPLNGITFLLPVDESALRLSIKCKYREFTDLDCDAYVAKIFFPIIPTPPLSKTAFEAIPGTHGVLSDEALKESGFPEWVGMGLGAAMKEVYNEVYRANPRLAVRAAAHTLGRLARSSRGQIQGASIELLSNAQCIIVAGIFHESTVEFRELYLDQVGLVIHVASWQHQAGYGTAWFGDYKAGFKYSKEQSEYLLRLLHKNPPVLRTFLWMDSKIGVSNDRQTRAAAAHKSVSSVMRVLA